MQTNDIYNSNLRALRRFGNAAQRVESAECPFECRRVELDGAVTVEVQKNDKTLFLSSRKNPAREAQRLVSAVLDGGEQFVVIAGIGMGYLLEAMLDNTRETKFLVIEPSEGLFRFILGIRDLSSLLTDERVIDLLLDPGFIQYSDLVEHPSDTRFEFVPARPYLNLFPEAMKGYADNFNSFMNSRRINVATLGRFDRLWTRNTFRNAEYFFSSPGAKLLYGRFRGIPALVIGAGPSVEEDLETIGILAKRTVLIAVDTALKSLLMRGIIPDFTVTVDPQFINSLHLAFLPQKDLPVLVADPAVSPAVLRGYRGPKVLTSSVFNPGKIIERFSGTKGGIAAGGSVSTTAFDLARRMGADPVILMGMDLSYKPGRTHLRGSFIESYVFSRHSRLETPDTFFTRYIRGGNPGFVKNRDGITVVSDSRMLLYRSWFEHSIEPGSSVLNGTRGGLSLHPIEDVNPDRLPSIIPDRKKKTRCAVEAARSELKKLLGNRAGMDGFMNYMDSVLRAMAGLKKAAREAEDLNRTGRYEKLAPLDEKILSFTEENRLISMVMQKPIAEIMGTRAETKKTSVENAGRLYRAIAEAADYVTALLERTRSSLGPRTN